jgi:GNAT superfamily N-acetyltransferase
MECFVLVEVQNSENLVQAIRIESATVADAEALSEVSRRAFEQDIDYGRPCVGGPPGYDSPDWQREAIESGNYYKVTDGGRIVGGLVLFTLDGGTVRLGRAFLEPERQNKGIGSDLLRFAESVFPGTRRFVLDTPVWNLRTRHLYEKFGYVKSSEIESGFGFPLIQYEKRIVE